ncbi:MAG: hypothetical protein WC657_06890 [Candidatus Paceibacterota bacterium]|jgi:hypothetical protein
MAKLVNITSASKQASANVSVGAKTIIEAVMKARPDQIEARVNAMSTLAELRLAITALALWNKSLEERLDTLERLLRK